MLSEMRFTRENLDQYLKELAKEFRKRNGKSMPAENQFSEYYRTFSNVVTFRTVIVMKGVLKRQSLSLRMGWLARVVRYTSMPRMMCP